MDNQQNKYISVSYQLHSIDAEGKKHLEEQTQQGNPFQFISGFGVTLDAFEKQLIGLAPADKFDFTLQPSEAFGEYDSEGVHKLSRDVFSINGHFYHENIFEGAVITLMDADEKRFGGTVIGSAWLDQDELYTVRIQPDAGARLPLGMSVTVRTTEE